MIRNKPIGAWGCLLMLAAVVAISAVAHFVGNPFGEKWRTKPPAPVHLGAKDSKALGEGLAKCNAARMGWRIEVRAREAGITIVCLP